MTRVQIVTDSTARFPLQGFLNRYPVHLAPMKVSVGSSIIQDHPAADLEAIRRLLEDDQQIPIAEPPSVEEFAQIYAQVLPETDQILSLHTSSGLCDVVSNAEAASRRFLGRVDIHVIDSCTASVGLGLLVQAAAEAIERGCDLEALVRLTRGMIPRLYMVFFLDDLFYLERKNLVSRSQAILGNMLGILPFLTMEGGQMTPMEKVRSRPRAIEKLIEFVCEFSAVEHLAILQNSLRPTKETLSIIDRLRSYHPDAPVTTACYGPSLSAFVGLESLGVVVLEAEEESL